MYMYSGENKRTVIELMYTKIEVQYSIKRFGNKAFL